MNANDIIKKWEYSQKKNLLITGDLGRGKSTIFQSIVDLLKIDAVYTKVYAKDGYHHSNVRMSSNTSDQEFEVASFDKQMQCHVDVFNIQGVELLKSLHSNIIGIDEIGFLERDAKEYCEYIDELFHTKQVVGVIRKNKSNAWMDALRNREDTLLIDLDTIRYPVDVIVMASGFSKRFGENKLLLDWYGNSVFEETIKQFPFDMVQQVVVVSRYEEIKTICDKYDITCILHHEERQSDTIRIGMEALKTSKHKGVMFLTCDQPLRKKRSIRSLILTFMNDTTKFTRLAYQDKKGNPVIFPQLYDKELENLQAGEKGNTIIRKYPNKETLLYVDNPYELADIDDKQTYEALKKTVKP